MKSPIPSVVFLILAIVLSSCQEQINTIKKDLISGQVQKGPYINGTSLLMSELNSSLEQTGSVYTAQISDDLGSFQLSNITLSSSFVEFAASGFYFNEITGEISQAQLNLNALSSIEDKSSINVNILTHLEKRRVEYLVKDGLSFIDAKSQAQEEILLFFGFDDQSIGVSEVLDITNEGVGNSVLLAISIMLQGDRTVGELTELLSKISTDLADNGHVNDTTIKGQLRESLVFLDFQEIRSNLEQRYSALGFSVVIPDFETYVNDFLISTAKAPSCEAFEATNVESSTATLRGYVNPNSLTTDVVFEYGFVGNFDNSINADQSPLEGNNKSLVSINLTDLNPGSEYNFRIKAENSNGVIYSTTMAFSTSSDGVFGEVIDVEGNIYSTVGIGEQIWMAENLKVTKYNDGNNIPYIEDYSAWEVLGAPGYCWYNNSRENYWEVYGALYNWYVVDSLSNGGKNPCPEGWRVPRYSDWAKLIIYLGGANVADEKMLDTENNHWNNEILNATNESGFSALPSGLRDLDGHYDFIGESVNWWSSSDWENPQDDWQRTQAYRIMIHPSELFFVYMDYSDKNFGISIRCLKE